MSNQKTTIDDLIETPKDGQEGFKRACESVKNQQLKSLFDEYSRQYAEVKRAHDHIKNLRDTAKES